MKGYQELNNVRVSNALGVLQQDWSDWLEGYWWVRRVVIRVEANRPFDIFIQRRSSDGAVGAEILANSVAEVPAVGERSETDFEITGAMSFRVGVKNNGGSAGSFKVSLILAD